MSSKDNQRRLRRSARLPACFLYSGCGILASGTRLVVSQKAATAAWHRAEAWPRLPSRLELPHGIARDAQRRIYVADREIGRVQLFSSRGECMAQWRPDGTTVWSETSRSVQPG